MRECRVREYKLRECSSRRKKDSRPMARVHLPSSPRYAADCDARTSRDSILAADVFPTYFPLIYAFVRHSNSPISYQDHIHQVPQMKDCCMPAILLNALQEHVLTRHPVNTDLNIQMLLHLLTMWLIHLLHHSDTLGLGLLFLVLMRRFLVAFLLGEPVWLLLLSTWRR